MADPVLKFPGEQAPPAAEAKKKPLSGRLNKTRRWILLVVIPLVAGVIGLVVYLSGGRYMTTDNAYVGSQKVLITPDISGKVSRVIVREGQHVKAGDELFEIDREPFRIAVDQAQAKLATVRADFTNLKSDFQVYSQLADVAQQNADLKIRDVDRKKALAESRAGSQVDYETAASAQLTARLQAQLAVQRKDQAFNQLLGDPNLPIEKFPAFMLANAALEQAQRDLDHTLLRAPIDGMATQVDNIQLGRFVAAGTPVFSVIDDQAPWVEANPKETDITYLRVGQKATLDVDSFPDHTFTGTVIAVSPGTGAQFSILPPQNATGNWVKVVQRVPVRIAFDKSEDTHLLRSGMSVNVEIDTGHSRLPFMATQAKETKK